MQKYTLADEQAVFTLRRIEEKSEPETSEKLQIPVGSIGGILRRYEKRLTSEDLLEDLMSEMGLDFHAVMMELEKLEHPPPEDFVRSAIDGDELLATVHMHVLLTEFDPENALLLEGDPEMNLPEVQAPVTNTPEEQTVYPSGEPEQDPIDEMVDTNYPIILKVLETKISEFVDSELDNMQVPAKTLVNGRDSLTLEDIQNLFFGFKNDVRDKIVQRLMERLQA